MKKIKLLFVLITMITTQTITAQVSINTDGTTPDASAMLDVKSTDKGLLPPRVANVSAVSSPVEGLQVYDISNQCMRYYNGASWSDCMGISSNDGNKTCGGTITDADGNTYNTVQIGTQCWMAENLNIGTMINGSSNQSNNSTIEKYCYDDNTTNCDTYGGLYQWDEMMQYATTEGTQGICPTGWHLPTDAEWMTLEEEVESTTGVNWNTTGWRGIDAGGNLKEAGTTHWNSPNTGATNSSGFTGLPGGYRYTDGSFDLLTNYAFFWSSSEYGSDAWTRNLYYGSAQVYRNGYDKAYGFSVRCVRD